MVCLNTWKNVGEKHEKQNCATGNVLPGLCTYWLGVRNSIRAILRINEDEVNGSAEGPLDFQGGSEAGKGGCA